MTEKLCCNCTWWDGVNGVPGIAPCKLKNEMVIWEDSCDRLNLIPKRMETGTVTNADRFFRNATDEQLAQYMDKIAFCEFCPARRERCDYGHECIDAWLEWLKQECE